MAIVPGICEDCGALFGSEALVGAVGPGIKLGGARVGPCPKCGGIGRVPEGVYDLIDDTLRVVRSADIHESVLDSVIELLEEHAQGELSDADFIEQMEVSAPGLSLTIRGFLAKSDPASWLALLLSILTLLQAPSSAPPSAEEIANAIWAKEHSGRRSKSVTTPNSSKQVDRRPRPNAANGTDAPRSRGASGAD